MGFSRIRRIGLGVVVVFMAVQLLLRDTAYQNLISWLGHGIILILAIVLVLMYLHRYRP